MDFLKVYHAIEEYLKTDKGMVDIRAINHATLPNFIEAWGVDADKKVHLFRVTLEELKAFAEKAVAAATLSVASGPAPDDQTHE